MPDQERFELDLRNAVRGYAGAISSDLDAVQLARTIAVAHPRRPFAGIGLRLPAGPIARIAWVLVLVAVLVAATLAFAVGIRPPQELPAVLPPNPAVYRCPPGSTPDEPGAYDQVRPPIGEIRIAVDRESGRLVALVPTESEDGWATWDFDLCSNTWAGPGPVLRLPGAERLSDLVYDWRLDMTIAIGHPGQVATRTDGWSWQAVPGKAPPDDGWARFAYDPDSGLVLAMDPTHADDPTVGGEASPPQLWTYAASSGTWASITQTGTGPTIRSGDHTLVAYDTSVGRLVAVNGEIAYTGVLDPETGAWVGQQPTLMPLIQTGYFAFGGEIAYDETAARVIVFTDGQVATYDAATNEWAIVFMAPARGGHGTLGPLARSRHRLAYDPTNERVIMVGGSYRTLEGWISTDDVWAFTTTTRVWTQLLAPSRFVRMP